MRRMTHTAAVTSVAFISVHRVLLRARSARPCMLAVAVSHACVDSMPMAEHCAARRPLYGGDRVVRQAGNELVCCIEVRLGGMPSSFVSIALPSIIAKLSHGSKHPRTTHVGGQFSSERQNCRASCCRTLSELYVCVVAHSARIGRSWQIQFAECSEWSKDSSLIALQHCTGMRCRRASGGAAGGDEGDTAA